MIKALVVLFLLRFCWTIVVITDQEIDCNKNYYSVEINSRNDENGDLMVNFTPRFLVNLTKYIHTYTINLASNENDKNYETQLFTSTVDACKIQRGLKNNFILKMILEALPNKTNYMVSCPVIAGVYGVKDLRVSERIIPSFLLRNVPFMFKFEGRGKASGEREMVKLFTIKLFGKFVASVRSFNGFVVPFSSVI